MPQFTIRFPGFRKIYAGDTVKTLMRPKFITPAMPEMVPEIVSKRFNQQNRCNLYKTEV